MSKSFEIAYKVKPRYWDDLKSEIDNNPNETKNWVIAYNEILFKRIKERYLDPIDILHSTSHNRGVGFSIVAIQCSLIEFLETTMTGEKYVNSNPKKKDYEYNKSRHKFINFLSSRFPFNKRFDYRTAEDFYESVRCGLLHEAQTKNRWLIRVDNKKEIIEVDKEFKCFDRIKFQEHLEYFFKRYKEDLITKKEIQSALRRKLNIICDFPIDS